MPTPSMGFCGVGRGDGEGVGPRSEEPARAARQRCRGACSRRRAGRALSSLYPVGRRAQVGEDAVDARWTCSAGAAVEAAERSVSR